jgi:hypothetical protein
MNNQITERALACLNATNEAIRSDYRDEACRIDFAARLRGLLYRRESGFVAGRVVPAVSRSLDTPGG